MCGYNMFSRSFSGLLISKWPEDVMSRRRARSKPWRCIRSTPRGKTHHLSPGVAPPKVPTRLGFVPLPNPGMEPESLTSPALTGGFFTTSATWEAHYIEYLQSNNNGQERRGALTEGAWHPLPPPVPAAVSSQALDVTHKSPVSRQAKGPPLYRVRMRIQKGNILIRCGKEGV